MDRMKRLVRSVRERYPDRYILLDCPPLARSADTQILLELCDYVVVVVPYARITPREIANSLEADREPETSGRYYQRRAPFANNQLDGCLVLHGIGSLRTH